MATAQDIKRIEHESPYAQLCWEEFRLKVGEITLSVPVRLPIDDINKLAKEMADDVSDETKNYWHYRRLLIDSHEYGRKKLLLDAAARLENAR